VRVHALPDLSAQSIRLRRSLRGDTLDGFYFTWDSVNNLLLIHVVINSHLSVALLAVYALLTNPLLLIAIGFLSGGFVAINKFGEYEKH
jgi:predicted membrane metal-binding protein